MSSHPAIDSRWWYALLCLFVLFFSTAYITIPDVTALILGLNVALIGCITVCVVMDTRSIRNADLNWNPSAVYAMGAVFTPILILYAVQRWRYVGAL